MSNLKFSINAEEMASLFGDLKKEVEAALTDGVQRLASMTHAKTLEHAQSELTSTRKKYTDALSFEEIEKGVWVVSLDESALFIEEGRKSGSMVDDLLRNNAKVSKDGNRYKAIPFEHSKPPSQQTPKAKEITDQIKRELRSVGVPFKKIEYNPDGSPRIGKLHKFDFPSNKPSAMASHPALSGLTIYQHKTSGGNIRRDIMTFRMVSDKSKAEGKWHHPGLEARKFMDKAFASALQEWESEILPEILNRFK